MEKSTQHISVPTLLIALLLSGCTFTKKPLAISGSKSAIVSDSSGISANGLEGFRRSVFPFAKTTCVGCHGSSQTPFFAASDIYNAYRAAVGLVNFVDIPGSRFMAKVQDGHCGAPCSADGVAMQRMIEDWKAAFAANEDLPGSVIPLGKVFTQSLAIPSENDFKNGGCTNPTQQLTGNPDGVNGTDPCWRKLRFPFAHLTPAPVNEISRGWFEVDFAYENFHSDLGAGSYVIKNPRIVTPDYAVYVHDVKIFIGHSTSQNHAREYRRYYGEAYRANVDAAIAKTTFSGTCTIPDATNPLVPFDPSSIGSKCLPSTPVLFSTAVSASGIVQETTSDNPVDYLYFSFEYLQKSDAVECKDVELFKANVLAPIKAGVVACLGCHRVAGADTFQNGQLLEAGQRFNMDPNDLLNGADDATRTKTVCQKFLQRSNFQSPDQSPMIVQPQKGLNGMPAQANFESVSPHWISWIKRETCLAKSATPADCPLKP